MRNVPPPTTIESPIWKPFPAPPGETPGKGGGSYTHYGILTSSGLKFRILKGTNFKAITKGHQGQLVFMNALKMEAVLGQQGQDIGHRRPWPRWPPSNLSPAHEFMCNNTKQEMDNP